MFVEILCRTCCTSPLCGLEFWGGERFRNLVYSSVTELQRRNNRSILVQGIIMRHCDFSKNNDMLTWFVFVRASLHMRREEKPTRCHWMLYCTYDMFKMFRALICPSSGARDYLCVITAYGVQCLVVGCRGSDAGQPAVSPGRGMLHHAALHLTPDNQRPSTSHHRRQ